ncbi:MAG: hypothetical protein J5819_05100 [Eubacterium sp.]|nr:hypothetical protein [Eubacterium sp.]
MKNSNFFPFERNRYFYGKLLSVDDFELEQKYMNDKRRMINRFLFGSGVVSGLFVVGVDEQTISVETGFALDSWGREVVVDEPVLKKLSLIEGYEHCRKADADVVYLCIEYDEKETDQVHNIAGQITANNVAGDTSFSRIREGYRLYLTAQEPDEKEKNSLSVSGFYENSEEIWSEGDVYIVQTVPKFIRAGRTENVRIRVENRGRATVSFSYDLVLNNLTSPDGHARITVEFDEALFERDGEYEIIYPVHAPDITDETAYITVDPDSVHLSLSDSDVNAEMSGRFEVSIVDCDIDKAAKAAYYRRPIEEVASAGYHSPIYLAAIRLVFASDTYIIENVKNVPFDQYVTNQMLDEAMFRLGDNASGESKSVVDESSPVVQERAADGVRISQGVTEVAFRGGGARGDKFFTPEITHGLGLGHVTIVLGIERPSGGIIYGAQDIFTENEDSGIDVELAARLNRDDGTFVIGARLLSGVKEGKVKVHWTAIRDSRKVSNETTEKRIFIKPNMLELTVRQSHRLEAVCENMVEKEIQWSVRDEEGYIDETGLYTAASVPGVYEVVAQSVAYPDVRASIFVVVREE